MTEQISEPIKESIDYAQVNEWLPRSCAILWNGCHDIYLIKDQKGLFHSKPESIEYNTRVVLDSGDLLFEGIESTVIYDPLVPEYVENALCELEAWVEESCSMYSIHLVSLEKNGMLGFRKISGYQLPHDH